MYEEDGEFYLLEDPAEVSGLEVAELAPEEVVLFQTDSASILGT